MKIYLDNCCYNRPFDDQTQLTISIETQAKLQIQREIVLDKHQLVTSYILRMENAQNPFENRRFFTEDFIRRNSSEHIGVDEWKNVEEKAKGIMETGIKEKDALHVASAIVSGCDCFITTDKRLLKYSAPEIMILNPVDFIRLEDTEK